MEARDWEVGERRRECCVVRSLDGTQWIREHIVTHSQDPCDEG